MFNTEILWDYTELLSSGLAANGLVKKEPDMTRLKKLKTTEKEWIWSI